MEAGTEEARLSEEDRIKYCNDGADDLICESLENGNEDLCMPCGVIEGRVPDSPSPEEKAEHDKTHLPFKNWCPICVGAKANVPAHR